MPDAMRLAVRLTLVAALCTEAAADVSPAQAFLADHPVIRQTEDVTCGPAALANLLGLQFGLALTEAEIVADMLAGRPLAAIRQRGGFSLLEIAEFAESRGYAARGERGLDTEALAERLPAIAQVALAGGGLHFVVVAERDGARFAVLDPATGAHWVAATAFDRHWTGVVLTLSGP
ncbi:MAG: cysteine peptidase family C39 domain-containing protein [Paracoccaceae bacterium]|nr:cysteine peptidase family C39 domain-containing protein [Paracoccaceae bacterium]